MPTLRRALAALLLVLAVPLPAQPAAPGQPQSAGPGPEVSLLSFAPGKIYWQRFGHNALLVRGDGAPRVYNYGIFDFRQRNFFLNFARGRMLYRLDVAPLDWTLEQYAAEGRWAVEQRLALSAEQHRALAAFLDWNARPEHADYRYDYFLANCSTRVRDALDAALGGALQRQLQQRPGHGSYRSEVLRLMSPVPALRYGMDLGLGPRVDLPLNQWQEAFIPMRLMDALRQVEVGGSDGARRPLVTGERVLVPAVADPPRAAGSPLLPFLLAGLLAGGLLLALRRPLAPSPARRAATLLGALHVLVCGLAGTVLALGWAATEHWGMAANRNLLLLNPVWLLLLPASLAPLRRPPSAPGRVLRSVSWLLLVAALLALPLALLGRQPNLHWVTLLLPLHAATLLPLLRARR